MAKTTPKTSAKKNAQNSPATDEVVPVEQRKTSDRRQSERRSEGQAVATERRSAPRRKVQRRRQIDPTTCERDYSDQEIEFMHAIDHFKRTTGRSFPSCQDVLDVITRLGYQKA